MLGGKGKMKLNKCKECNSKRLYNISDELTLCMDCKTLHSIEVSDCDRLSFWIWNREYKKKKSCLEEDLICPYDNKKCPVALLGKKNEI